jgi:ABC-type phosphate/phosphonate transport system substrate-binding protein
VFGPRSHHRPFQTVEKFGGVIVTRADNTEINKLDDISGKIVAAAAISSCGGGLMQFRELQNAGLSYINDPKQVVFTGDQAAIVKGVIDGEFDVGFVRTDQIERTVDDDGNPVDGSLLKVLEPKDNKIDDQPFPFKASTRLYPEWNLGALDFVPADVSAEVQAAMLALHEHSLVGEAIEKCIASNTTSNTTGVNSCEDLSELAPEARCDTTKEVAEVANRAMTNGGYAGFRTAQSFSDIREMLQETMLISQDKETKAWRCARPTELYKAIACPEGHFKRPEEEVMNGCAESGLKCGEGFDCVCNPCKKSFDVDVYPLGDSTGEGSGLGCAKLSLCGDTQQGKPLAFRAIDNKNRDGAFLNVTVHDGGDTSVLLVLQEETSNTYENTYEFEISAQQVGILIIEISFDGSAMQILILAVTTKQMPMAIVCVTATPFHWGAPAFRSEFSFWLCWHRFLSLSQLEFTITSRRRQEKPIQFGMSSPMSYISTNHLRSSVWVPLVSSSWESTAVRRWQSSEYLLLVIS